MDWIHLLETAFWSGIAAIGFAVIFNVPVRALPVIYIMAALAGSTRLLVLQTGASLVVASLSGSLVIGFLSIPFAHIKHAPPLVFSIPSVIPLIPGVLAFKMMQGIMYLAGDATPPDFIEVLSSTVNNGLRVMFILLSLAGGVAMPMLLARKQSVKHVKVPGIKK